MNPNRWWDLAVSVVTVAIIAVSASAPPSGIADGGALAGIGVFLLSYVTMGRRLVASDGGRLGIVLAAGVALGLGIGVAFEPNVASLQLVAYPLVWVTSERRSTAIAGNLLVAAAIALGFGIGTGEWVDALTIAGLSLAFSLGFGLWFNSVAEHGAERARLLEELQQAQGELAALHRESGIVSERERLSREIHDTLAQTLAGLVMLSERARREFDDAPDDPAAARSSLDSLEQAARSALAETRALVASTAPADAADTFADAVQRLVARFRREAGLQITVSVDHTGLDRETEVVLLRCLQEALANVWKHAAARSVRVGVATGERFVELTVADDGRGFDASADGDGFGLAGMRERVALAAGRCEVTSSPQGGTVVRVSVPRRAARDLSVEEHS